MGNAKLLPLARGNLPSTSRAQAMLAKPVSIFSNLSLSYHASAEGIEISYDNGRCRLLLANSILYALNPFVAGQNERAILYTGTDGKVIVYATGNSHGEAARLAELMQLGLNNTNGVTVNGLTVFVDENGSVIAHTEEEGERQPLSITIAADEHVEMVLQMVGLDDRMDHYPHNCQAVSSSRVAPARAIVTDPPYW